MTKKDYESIAEMVRKQGAYVQGRIDVVNLVGALTDYLEMDNPRFDRSRFLAACRGEDSTDSAGRKVSYGR